MEPVDIAAAAAAAVVLHSTSVDHTDSLLNSLYHSHRLAHSTHSQMMVAVSETFSSQFTFQS